MTISAIQITRRATAALLLGTFLAGGAAAQTYTVGSTPSGVPFTFLDVATNKIDGVMVDIIDAVGEAVGFEADVQATQWSALIPSLTSGKIDIIAAAMYATEDRAKVVAFSEPVYTYGEGLFVGKDDTGTYHNWDDLTGKVIGAQVGTSYYDRLNDSGKFAEVKVYDTIADIMRDVSLGRIDAGIADWPIVAYQLSKGASDVRVMPEYESQMVGDVSIAVRQEDTELLERINTGLAEIKASGRLDEIIAEWGIE